MEQFIGGPVVGITFLFQGMTRLFLTKIPFFREVIVSSFTCDHCGFRNAEVQSGGRIQDKGVQYSAIIKTPQVCINPLL